jgi:transglutaminase-like putative cysteine protease
MPLLTVRHVTTYRYANPVAFGEHRLMVRPREGHDLTVIDAQLAISPLPAAVRWVHDVFGNSVALVRFSGRATELRFESTVTLQHVPDTGPEFSVEDDARWYPFAYDAQEAPDLLRLIERQYLDPEHEIDRWARQFVRPDSPTGTSELLIAMTHAIKERFTYVPRTAMGTQDPIDTLRLGSGSCRDFAVLMIEAVRSLGMAARFVSGYLYVPNADGQGHVGGGATHAWVQVYLPGAGWVEFDPTNGIIGNRDLIRVAVVRDPRQAVPLSGTWIGLPSDNLGMSVEVSVTSAESAGLAQRIG